MQSSRVNPIWTAADKRKLHELLQTFPLSAYNNLATRLKTKSADQVQLYIETLKRAAIVVSQSSDAGKEAVKKAPIEEWIGLTQGLVGEEDSDLSGQLGQVMSIISHLESFPERKSGQMQPDYRAIYHYLGQLLNGQDLDELGPLESAVLLEVFHSLMEVLSGADTSVQRNVMRWKYQLINTTSTTSLRKVIENDFSDFLNDDTILVEDDNGNTAATPQTRYTRKHSTGMAPAAKPTEVPRDTSDPQHVPVSASPLPVPTTSAPDAQDTAADISVSTSSVGSMSSPSSLTSTHTDNSVPTSTESTASTPQPSNHTSSQSTGRSKPTPFRRPRENKVEYVLVMPPVNATIVNEVIGPGNKSKQAPQTRKPSISESPRYIPIDDPNKTVPVPNTSKVKEAIFKKLNQNRSKEQATQGVGAENEVEKKGINAVETPKTVQNNSGKTVQNNSGQTVQNNSGETVQNNGTESGKEQQSQRVGISVSNKEKEAENQQNKEAENTGTTPDTVPIPPVANVKQSPTTIQASKQKGNPYMTGTTSGTSTGAQTYTAEEEQRQLSKEKKDTWKRKLVSTKSKPGKSPKKPKLYSLNPLCIPVSLLDLA